MNVQWCECVRCPGPTVGVVLERRLSRVDFNLKKLWRQLPAESVRTNGLVLAHAKGEPTRGDQQQEHRAKTLDMSGSSDTDTPGCPHDSRRRWQGVGWHPGLLGKTEEEKTEKKKRRNRRRKRSRRRERRRRLRKKRRKKKMKKKKKTKKNKKKEK